jgi:Putative zinc ribbon domain
MTKTCPSCYSCGMPLKQPSDFACGDIKNKYCSHCTDEKGKLKPYQEIVEGTANYLVHSQGLNRSAALEIAENMISKQPEWQKRK